MASSMRRPAAGDPGFIREVAPNTFEIPDFAGNTMYQSLGNLQIEPRVCIGSLSGHDFVVLDCTSTTHWDAEAERKGGTGHYWRFTPYSWQRTPMPVELSGYERSSQTAHLD
ncbi:hypothetical protein ACFVWP_33680 [Streptomyces sp. NPDC058175]|uniref:hypothetical protein n=1 Tax=Streptomyces sp. NPDC058175 TaxID=3346367 RepID=UPI0036E8A0CE